MQLDTNFWKDKKVFITGHTGFKGSWMTLLLTYMGANVSGYSLKPYSDPNLFEEAGVAVDIKNIFADIRDENALRNAIFEHKPEIIIHMAAQPLVRRSYKDPIETFSTNVIGTANLLEAARHSNNTRVVINVTTDKCYENKEWLWAYREDEPMGGYDPYSSSKACSELITKAYRKSFYKESKIALASARAGNVIGGGDWSDDRLIPDILSAFQDNRPVIIRNPESIRPWQHVLEPIHGYLLLAEKMYDDDSSYSEAWNFGPNEDDSKSVEWVIEEMVSKWGSGASWINDTNKNPHEANFLKLDISKAKIGLKWQPKWSLNQALDHIVSWHKGWINDISARELCIKQIENFINN
jgi:CDP-glucose 4,6-dehydratase